jgi:protein-S-isoprenylcysteine O-methyltransferase Ste14
MALPEQGDSTRPFRRAHHAHREDLAPEHPRGDSGQVLLVCLFAATWVTDTFFLGYTTFLNAHVPLTVRIGPATLVFILSGYLAKTGLSIVFGEKRSEPDVIRKSVFGRVRHPIYLGEILLYLGFLLLSLSLASLLVWLVAVGFLHHIARYEERLLVEKYGEAYARYMREVPMWIPRPGARPRY